MKADIPVGCADSIFSKLSPSALAKVLSVSSCTGRLLYSDTCLLTYGDPKGSNGSKVTIGERLFPGNEIFLVRKKLNCPIADFDELHNRPPVDFQYLQMNDSNLPPNRQFMQVAVRTIQDQYNAN